MKLEMLNNMHKSKIIEYLFNLPGLKIFITYYNLMLLKHLLLSFSQMVEKR